ncbi:UNVERIFIED_CONTAM: hypothetical protein Slati_4395600 [Sesamum latifolium]|uniref:Uncharacterized protein n=1 Tax=Sesamum latifolium TaxID=2727402 RepID=A0AAW2SQ87_9LAMI
METLVRFSVALVFLCFISEGMSENKCSPSDITVKQNPTGTKVQGKPEFQVTLFNACPCPVANVKLACNGFHTVENIPQTFWL